MLTNSKTSLKGVEWGSPKFYEIVAQTTSEHDFTVDKRRIDNLINKLKTNEGWEYLKTSVAEYYGH